MQPKAISRVYVCDIEGAISIKISFLSWHLIDCDAHLSSLLKLTDRFAQKIESFNLTAFYEKISLLTDGCIKPF